MSIKSLLNTLVKRGVDTNSAPSTSYVQSTPTDSGSSYTTVIAPFNGFALLVIKPTKAGKVRMFMRDSVDSVGNSTYAQPTGFFDVCIPVRKGASVMYTTEGGINTAYLRFIKSVGGD